METKEKTYNGMVINGFSAILFNLVMLPALAFLNFYLLEEVVWLAVPILLVLILAFVLISALEKGGALNQIRTER